MFVKDFTSLLPFLTVFLNSNYDNLKQECSHPSYENEDLRSKVQALFMSLSDIFQCWLTSQYFRREFQTYMHQVSHLIKFHWGFIKNVGYFSHVGGGTFRRPQIPGNSKNQSRKKDHNIILVCLEMLLPVVEKLLSPEDRVLADMCTSKLGNVRLCGCSERS